MSDKLPRLLAHFRPPAWVNGYAIAIDDPQEDFDATTALLEQELGAVRTFKEHSDGSDYLAELACKACKYHSGPFEMDVGAFFAAHGLSRQALTQGQLDGLRQRYGVKAAGG